ncbi:MAG: hypothetical protein ACRDL8_20075 [Solirubrobacteraceae bacterium]
MSHPELVPAFVAAFAIELAHLRSIMLTHWRCRHCNEAHLYCDCKYGWLKRLL